MDVQTRGKIRSEFLTEGSRLTFEDAYSLVERAQSVRVIGGRNKTGAPSRYSPDWFFKNFKKRARKWNSIPFEITFMLDHPRSGGEPTTRVRLLSRTKVGKHLKGPEVRSGAPWLDVVLTGLPLGYYDVDSPEGVVTRAGVVREQRPPSDHLDHATTEEDPPWDV